MPLEPGPAEGFSASSASSSQEELAQQEAIRLSNGEAAANSAAPFRTPPPENPDCEPDSYAYLTGSAPDFVVYRNPADPAPTAEPEPEVTAAPDDNNDDGSTDVNGTDSTETNEEAPAPMPEPTEATPAETAAPDIVPTPDESVENPTISFGVHVSGFQGWKATVSVYALSSDGTLGPSLASYDAINKTEVHWDELFPDSKPSSGAYLYDIKIQGTNVEGAPASAERTPGISTDANSKETQRLDTALTIADLGWDLSEPDPRSFGGPLDGSGDETELKVKFRLLRNGSSVTEEQPYLAVVSPQFERTDLDVSSGEDGFYHGTMLLKQDSPLDLGNLIFVSGSKGKVRVAVGAQKSADNSAKVLGCVAGFKVEKYNNNDQGWQPLSTSDERRRPEVSDRVTFRAFVRIKTIAGTRWYSDKILNNSQIKLHEWIGGNQWAGEESNVRTAPKTYVLGPLEKGLNLKFEWRKFTNETVDQANDGHALLWYGFAPLPTTPAGTSISLTRSVDLGVTWWGIKFSYDKLTRNGSGKGASGRSTYLLPTDRKKGEDGLQLFDATKPPAPTLRATGKGGRFKGPLWMPEPKVDGEWWGRICGRGHAHAIPFVDGDDFFDNPGTNEIAQAQFHSKILREAEGFLNTPYAWGGQSYGGRQSKSSSNFTYTSGSSYIDSGATLVPHSLTKVGYGIDCNGFVTGAYHLACGSSPYGARDEGPNSSALARYPYDKKAPTNTDSTKPLSLPVDDQFLAPGDYIVMPGSHVVYVRNAPELVYNPVKRIMEVQTVATIEANVGIKSANGLPLRGRARFDDWSGGKLRRDNATNRRWLPR